MVSYDNTEVAERKTGYIRDERLGGAMWWESSGDKQGDMGLIATVSYDPSPMLLLMSRVKY